MTCLSTMERTIATDTVSCRMDTVINVLKLKRATRVFSPRADLVITLAVIEDFRLNMNVPEKIRRKVRDRVQVVSYAKNVKLAIELQIERVRKSSVPHARCFENVSLGNLESMAL